MLKKIKEFQKLTFEAFRHFQKNEPLMLASATSFFTTFSLPPITILVVNILSVYFFKADRIRENLYDELSATFGSGTADQISSIALNFRGMADNTFYTIAGTVFLIFVATTLFFVVQTAIHQIWRIKYTKKRSLSKLLRQRGVSLLMIVAASILMLLTLFAETLISFLGEYLGEMFPELNKLILIILGSILSVLIYTIWFAILFRYLPDARIPFKIALKGGLFTSVLFSLGKYILGFLLVTDRMGNLFGASASVMVLMLFIFYSSMMVYFGASFTYILLGDKGMDMRTKRYSVHTPG